MSDLAFEVRHVLPACVDVSVSSDDLLYEYVVATLTTGEGKDISQLRVRIPGPRQARRAYQAGDEYAVRFHEHVAKLLTDAALALCEYPERFAQ